MEERTIPVPKLLWDELESALMIKAKQLICDIAKTLHQDEKVLLQEFRSKKTKVFLVDSESEEHPVCEAYVYTKAVAYKCGKPSMFSKKVCPEHEHYDLTKAPLQSQPLQRIENENLFVHPETNDVYTLDYERVGYVENNKCIVFQVDYA